MRTDGLQRMLDFLNLLNEKNIHFFIERYTESFVTEMAAFVNAILHDAPVPVSGYDGRVPVVMALAAGKSLAEHRLVRLSEIEQ